MDGIDLDMGSCARVLRERYRCPEEFLNLAVAETYQKMQVFFGLVMA